VTEPIIEGDPFGTIKDDAKPTTPPPREVNLFHTRSDVDSSKISQHHTLGVKNTQAAAGDHVHDGQNSRKIGQGLGLNVVSSGTDTATIDSLLVQLHRIIDFTES
jgi:hypothetical protein